MAMSKKSLKPKAADPSKLKPETAEKVEVKELMNDERTHKIMGAFFLLIAFLLFVAFTSYLFTWQEDMSVVSQGASILLPSHEQPMANMLGAAGAYFSHVFFRSGFGIASYIVCTLFFIAGINLFLGRKVFSLVRNIKYVIVGLIVISVSAAFITKGSAFPWGGGVGDMISNWMQQLIGKLGTAAVLLVAALSYIIWRFNPVFKLPVRNKNLPLDTGSGINDDELVISNSNDTFINNNHTSGKVVTPLTSLAVDDSPVFNHDLQIIEKQSGQSSEVTTDANDDEMILPSLINQPSALSHTVTRPLAVAPASDLELEIKAVPDEVSDESIISSTEKVKSQAPYNPILDLKNYK